MRRVHQVRPTISRRKSKSPRPSYGVLLVVALAFLISLGAVIRVNAMPAEARLSETWYSYRAEMPYDFSAKVQQGAIYSSPTVKSGDLLQIRLPVEPAAYRRALVAKLTDVVTLQLPYTFTADRPAEIKAKYWVDATLVVPTLWQRPMPLLQPTEIQVTGEQLVLDKLAVDIPIKQITAELEKLTQDMKLSQETAEIHIRPVVQVEVNGLKEAVKSQLNPEIVVAIRNTGIAVEVDDPKVYSDEKQFTETKVLPATFDIMGYTLPLETARRLAIGTLSVFALVLAVMLLVQWYRTGAKQSDLKKLGAALIVARGLDLPEDATMVEVLSTQQLLQIHLQTERPVIRVGDVCYILDGATCYRLELTDNV